MASGTLDTRTGSTAPPTLQPAGGQGTATGLAAALTTSISGGQDTATGIGATVTTPIGGSLGTGTGLSALAALAAAYGARTAVFAPPQPVTAAARPQTFQPGRPSDTLADPAHAATIATAPRWPVFVKGNA